MNRIKLFLVIIFLVFLCQFNQVSAVDVPGYSGMAQISNNCFLMVNDRKNPIESGYRIGVITITDKDGIIFSPISVNNWMHDEEEASDLEACCPIPNRKGEFLIAESGFYKEKFGRIFHVTLVTDNESLWHINVNKAFKIYNRKLDPSGHSYQGDQVEGIACFDAFGKTIVVYGERGGKSHCTDKVGTIVWGVLDFTDYKFDRLGQAPLVNQSILDDRDCSSLHLIENQDGSISVLSVATRDQGDNGPYCSVLYQAGQFILDPNFKTVQFNRSIKPHVIANLSGIKVEAMANPASNTQNSKLSIATDDENYGGIWRPIYNE